LFKHLIYLINLKNQYNQANQVLIKGAEVGADPIQSHSIVCYEAVPQEKN